jgi:hypothetical protein
MLPVHFVHCLQQQPTLDLDHNRDLATQGRPDAVRALSALPAAVAHNPSAHT